jgi:hypothetical protein
MKKEQRCRLMSERLRTAQCEGELAAAIDAAALVANDQPPPGCQALMALLLRARQQMLRDIPDARMRLEAVISDRTYELKDSLSKAIREQQQERLKDEIEQAEDFVNRMQQLPVREEARLQLVLPLEMLWEIKQKAALTLQAVELSTTLSSLAKENTLCAEVAAMAEQIVRAATNDETQLRDCQICLEEKRLRGGVSCYPEGEHFICDQCFRQYARHEVGVVDGAGVRNPHGRIQCPGTNCLGSFPLEVVARSCPSDVLEAVTQCRIQAALAIQEGRIRAEERERANREIEMMQKCTPRELAVQVSVRHVVENILTLKCPRCKSAFHDFDGCCALTCANYSCRCGFCAWCLRDCGKDAHDHVKYCPMKPAGADAYFGTMEQFWSLHRRRQEKEARSYLSTLEAATRNAVQERLQTETEDLGISLDC